LTKNLKLGEILKQAGIIDDFQLNSALSYQRHWGGRFGESLIKLGYLTEDKLQDFLARQFDLPQIELFGRKIPEDVLAYIPQEKAREFLVLPVERREISGSIHLVVAMTDPTNLMVTDSLQFMTGCRIKPALASDEAITSAIEKYYGPDVDDQDELDFALDDQEELDFVLDDLAELPKPTQPVVPVMPIPEPEQGSMHAPAPIVPAAAPAPDMGHYMAALKKLEDRYENLVRILLDRDLIGPEDLDELM
jgi:type IV pilus assembly protein PilB